MDFSHRLYDLRKRSGLSQEGLAELLGVTRQAVQKWEAGTSRPDMDNLTALARYFNVTLDWLITGQEAPSASDAPGAQTIVNYYCSERHYEYKSKTTLLGLPLVHINLGRGLRCARGIIAIGNVAAGVVSLGGLSFGGLALGGASAGLLSIGGLALGGAVWGGLALGLLAVGGISMGWLALGGIANGVYAVGAIANGTSVAIGALASAPLAIGDAPSGAATLLTDGSVPLSAIRDTIEQALGSSGWLSHLLTTLSARFSSVPLA